MSGHQQHFDDEFRAMMERIELREPSRYYGALAWLRPLAVVIVVLGLMVACTAAAGPFVYVAPVVFMAGVFGLARTLPTLRLRADASRAHAKLRLRKPRA